MKKTAISIKIWLLIVIVVLGLTFSNYKIQEQIKNASYYKTVNSEISSVIDSIRTSIREDDWNLAKIPSETEEVEILNDVKVGVVDKYGHLLNKDSFLLYVLDYEGVVYTIYLDNMFDFRNLISLDLETGMSISIEGNRWSGDSNNITMTKLKIDDELIFYEENLSDEKIMLESSLLSYKLPDNIESGFFNEHMLIENFLESFNSEEKTNIYESNYGEHSYIFYDELSSSRYYVVKNDYGKENIESLIVMKNIELGLTYEDLSVEIILVNLLYVVAILLIFYLVSRYMKRENEKYKEIILDKVNILEDRIEDIEKEKIKLKSVIVRERDVDNIRKEFIRDVSHEIKTPIGVIRGFAEGIQDGLAGDDVDYYIDVILDELEKVNDLVKDMLELSKYQTSAYELEKIEFDLSVVVYDTANKFKRDMEKRGLTIQYDDKPCLVKGDIKRLDQVIANFINNAMRYSDENSIIEIKAIEKENEVYFSIENSCQKMSEEQLIRIWDKFYKTDESRTNRFEGSGLGLSIVKEILQMHGASYGAENTERGVKFHFSIPK